MTKSPPIEQTKRLMGALLRMPPKPHSEMKIRRRTKPIEGAPPKKKSCGASAKPKTA